MNVSPRRRSPPEPIWERVQKPEAPPISNVFARRALLVAPTDAPTPTSLPSALSSPCGSSSAEICPPGKLRDRCRGRSPTRSHGRTGALAQRLQRTSRSPPAVSGHPSLGHLLCIALEGRVAETSALEAHITILCTVSCPAALVAAVRVAVLRSVRAIPRPVARFFAAKAASATDCEAWARRLHGLHGLIGVHRPIVAIRVVASPISGIVVARGHATVGTCSSAGPKDIHDITVSFTRLPASQLPVAFGVVGGSSPIAAALAPPATGPGACWCWPYMLTVGQSLSQRTTAYADRSDPMEPWTARGHGGDSAARWRVSRTGRGGPHGDNESTLQVEYCLDSHVTCARDRCRSGTR